MTDAELRGKLLKVFEADCSTDRTTRARSLACARSTSSTPAIGRGTVGFGTAGERHGWKLRREFISPRYTTVWDELLRV